MSPKSSLQVFLVGAMVCFAAMIGTAHAGAWEEFERRCLVPMEAGQEPVAEGLDEIDHGEDLFLAPICQFWRPTMNRNLINGGRDA